MKVRVLLVAITVLFIAMLTNQSYAKIDPKTIVGLWLFDEGSGKSVKDSTGNVKNGEIINAKWVDGKFIKALEFEGAANESYVSIPHSDILNQEIFTVAAWINVPGTSGWQTILAKDAMDIGAEELRTYGMFVISGQTGVHYSFKSKNKTHNTVNGKAAVADGKWHHVAMTYDGTTLRGYVDAVKDAEQAFAGPPIMHNGALNVGGEIKGRYNLKGTIDEVCILKVALDEAGIKTLMNGLANVISVEPSSMSLTSTWGAIKKQK